MAKKNNYQSFEPCLACGAMDVDRCYHHVKTRGAGGPDEDWNRASSCLEHHNEWHEMGDIHMDQSYPIIKKWFISNNWWVCQITGKWRHD